MNEARVKRAFKLHGDVRHPGDVIGAEELANLSQRTRQGLVASGFVSYVQDPATVPAVEGGGASAPPLAAVKPKHGKRIQEDF